MKKLVEFIVILLLFCSCEKQDSPGNAEPENVGIPLIVSEMYDEDLGWIYVYNEANLPEIVKTKWSYTQYFYNSNNQLTGYDQYEDPGIYSSNWETAQASMNRTEWVNPLNSEKSIHVVFYYDKGVLTKTTVNNMFNETSRTNEFKFDQDGRMIRESFDNGHVEYVYSADGNLVQRKQFHEGKMWVMIEYSYDNHPNPFIVFKKAAQPGRYTNKNNIIREKHTLYEGDGSIESEYTEESFFEYNEEGYPVKKNDMVTYTYE